MRAIVFNCAEGARAQQNNETTPPPLPTRGLVIEVQKYSIIYDFSYMISEATQDGGEASGGVWFRDSWTLRRRQEAGSEDVEDQE